MARVPEELPMVSKVRVAASVIESLSIVSENSIEVRKIKEKTMASVVAFDPMNLPQSQKEQLVDCRRV